MDSSKREQKFEPGDKNFEYRRDIIKDRIFCYYYGFCGQKCDNQKIGNSAFKAFRGDALTFKETIFCTNKQFTLDDSLSQVVKLIQGIWVLFCMPVKPKISRNLNRKRFSGEIFGGL